MDGRLANTSSYYTQVETTELDSSPSCQIQNSKLLKFGSLPEVATNVCCLPDCNNRFQYHILYILDTAFF